MNHALFAGGWNIPMNNKLKNIFSLLGIITCLNACGSLTVTPLDISDFGISAGSEAAFLFATDYASSGQLYFVENSSLENSGVANLGSSAVIRLFDGFVYVLHDGFSSGSSDNVQIINPLNSLSTVDQWSTGNGTNPHDIVVVEDEGGYRAYITLYNPDEDGDLIVMDLDTGEILETISFSDFLNEDGDKNANADQMVLVDDRLYVLIQDLQSDFSHNASGKIAVFDTDTHIVEEVITIQGRNPVDIVASEDGEKVFVALQAPYDFSLGNFDTSTDFGGIEIIDLDNTSNTTLLADDDLGGYVERLASGEGNIFAVISQYDSSTFTFSSDIVVIDGDASSISDVETFLEGSSDVRDIAADSSGNLWVARRTIDAATSTTSNPQVDVFNGSTGESIIDSMLPDVPVTSIAIGTL